MAPPTSIFIFTFVCIVIVTAVAIVIFIAVATFIVIVVKSFERSAHDEEQKRWRGRALHAWGGWLPGSLTLSRRVAREVEDDLLAVFLARRRLVFRGRVL